MSKLRALKCHRKSAKSRAENVSEMSENERTTLAPRLYTATWMGPISCSIVATSAEISSSTVASIRYPWAVPPSARIQSVTSARDSAFVR